MKFLYGGKTIRITKDGNGYEFTVTDCKGNEITGRRYAKEMAVKAAQYYADKGW